MARVTTAPSTSGSSVVTGRDTDGNPLPSLRRRMVPPMPRDTLAGWLAPIAIALIAGALRVWHLGRPAKFVFDETYYPKDAFSQLHFGVARSFVKNVNQLILNGDFDIFKGTAFVVHPPGGKWFMAAGEWMFGMDPFGWRIAVAVLGTVSVLVMARLVRRMTRSTLLGCAAGVLFAFDGLHFVESRTALLDLPMMVWMVSAFAFLLLDRDWCRGRLADAVEPLGRVAEGFGPRLLWRPWRLAAGVCFGISVATKWNAVFALAAFGILVWCWDVGARKSIGVQRARGTWRAIGGSALIDGVPAFCYLVVTSAVVYVASWGGWFASSDGYDRQWAAGHPASGIAALVPDALRSLWHYHADILQFHTHLTEGHPYASNPWGWLVVSRPVSFDWVDKIGPDQGCPTDRCVQEILGIGTPILWWAGVLALVACGFWWLLARDWRFGVPIVGVAATWLPWFAWAGRPIFYFYASAILPWVVIGLALVLGKIIGPREAALERRLWGAGLAAGFVVLVVANFAYLYPILTDQTIPYDAWMQRMWLKSWV